MFRLRRQSDLCAMARTVMETNFSTSVFVCLSFYSERAGVRPLTNLLCHKFFLHQVSRSFKKGGIHDHNSMDNADTPVISTRIPEQKVFDGKPFPLVLTPNLACQRPLTSCTETCGWIRDQKATIDNHLFNYGAILFRGFPLNDATDFDAFVCAFQKEYLPYGGAAPRKQITSKVVTANEAPSHVPIPFHHEMAHVPHFPSALFFYCDIPPTSGGETALVLSNEVYKRMDQEHPDFVQDLVDKKVRYSIVYPDGNDTSSFIGRAWQVVYGTDDRKEAERNLIERNEDWEWLSDGCLRTYTMALPAIREDGRTGKKLWFNSIITAYRGFKDIRNIPEKTVMFADGTCIPPAIIDDIETVMDNLAVDIPWQKGDVFLVDNIQVLHAKRPSPPPRLILASLVK